MKHLFKVLSVALLLLPFASCKEAPAEIALTSDSVETIGSGFKDFGPAGDVRVYNQMLPDGQFTLRAMIPLKKTGSDKIDSLVTSLDLLDANGVKLNDGVQLFGEDVASILPVFNDDPEAVRNVIYATRKELDPQAINSIVQGTVAVRLHLESFVKPAAPAPAPVAAVPAAAPRQQAAAPQFPANPTVNNLVAYYGIWNILGQYQAAYRKGNKALCKQLKGRLSSIQKQVKDHPNGGRGIANSLEDWIDDRIDDIEDKVDSKR